MMVNENDLMTKSGPKLKEGYNGFNPENFEQSLLIIMNSYTILINVFYIKMTNGQCNFYCMG